jgi:hypothetical protein
MFTEDYEPYNWFEVYVRDSSGSNLERIFYKAGTYPNPGLEEFGWEKVTYDLTKYTGATIQIYFAVANWYDTACRTWVYIDDIVYEHAARAEIYYEYTTSGGGGGCPYVSVWNDMQYLLDNNVMPSSESTTGDVVDYYLLQQPLVTNEEGLYSLLLSEFEEEHSFFDKVQLLAVDHSSNVSVAVSPSGEILTYTNPHPPVSAITNEKKDVKDLLSSVDGDYYEGCNGSYIILNFGDELDVSKGAKLVLRTDMFAVKTSIHVQVQDKKGKWNDVTSFIPRAYWSTDIIDMSNYLPDSRGSLKVRLYFTANHKIDFVGLDTSPQSLITVQQAQLVSAMHSKNGDPTVYGGTSESDVKSKLLYDDSAYAELMPYEQIKLAFGFSEAPAKDSVRDFIFVSKGHYRTLPPGTLIDPTVYGEWVCPAESGWFHAYVTASLPSTTTLLRVIIHGNPDFRAYIDAASLSIHDATSHSTNYGNFALGVSVYDWYVQYPNIGYARLIPTLYAEGKSGYYVHWTQIKVELLPNDGSSTSQTGTLSAVYVVQSNNQGYDVDPAADAKVEAQNFETAAMAVRVGTSIVVGIGLVVLTGGAGAAGLPAVLRVIGGTAGSTFISSSVIAYMQQFKTNADDPYAAGGLKGNPSDYSIHAIWQYRDHIKEYEKGWFVSDASASYCLNWQFNKDILPN